MDAFKPSDDASDKLKRWSSLIGIITAIIGNVLISFALNIQKYAHVRLAKQRRRDARKPRDGASMEDSFTSAASSEEGKGSGSPAYLRSPWWWFGIILMSIGECGNFLAYGFAPASIVSPLGVVALISNCIIAPVMLKEPFRLRDLLGIVVAVGGAVVVALSSNPEEKKLGPHQIWDAISQTAFEVYFGVTCGLIVVLLWASSRYGSKSILIDLGLVGLFGGYTALSTKGISSLLTYSWYKIVTYPVFYLLLLVLVSTAILQIKYINRALQRFNSTQVIPTQFVLFTLSVILGSAILYRDFERADEERMIKFVGGCALTFLGVYFITSGKRTNREDEDDEAESVYLDDGDYGYTNQEPFKPNFALLDDVDGDMPPTSSRRSSTNSYDTPQRPPFSTKTSSLAVSDTPHHPTRPNRRRVDSSRLSSRDISPHLITPDESSLLLPPSSYTASPTHMQLPTSHRPSMSKLLPGPLFVGYTLQAVSRSQDVLEGSGRHRLRKTRSHTGGWMRSASTSSTTSTRTPQRHFQAIGETPTLGSRRITSEEYGKERERERRGTVGAAENLEEHGEGAGRVERFIRNGGDALLPRPGPVHDSEEAVI